MHALTRALTAVAVVVLAVAAPVATPPVSSAGGQSSERTQDLRPSRHGQPSPTLRGGVYAAPTPAPPRRGRGVLVATATRRRLPTPAAHVSAPATPSDDGIPWMTLGFIVAGASLLVSGAVALTMRRRSPAAHAA